MFAKPDFRLKSKGASGIKDNWAFPQTKNSGHPASFPIQLPDNILETVKYKDVVCDPFCGSGTVCVSAKKFGCNYIGFDISEPYIEIAQKRINSEVL